MSFLLDGLMSHLSLMQTLDYAALLVANGHLSLLYFMSWMGLISWMLPVHHLSPSLQEAMHWEAPRMAVWCLFCRQHRSDVQGSWVLARLCTGR